MSIPQHRSSSTPLPTPAAERKRPLTENERILAKEYYGDKADPEAAYRADQEADIGEIVSPGFSLDKKEG